MKFNNKKNYKRCPRCNKKVFINQDKCDGCRLVFSRLSKATNSAAKKNIKKKEFNKVIMNIDLPKDVSKLKLSLYAIFLGCFGVHYAKVGRYKMFIWSLISCFLLTTTFFIPASWSYHEYLFLIPNGIAVNCALYFMFYVVSICQILFNKFPVPISIDEELVIENLDKDLVNDILQEVKKEENNNTMCQTVVSNKKNKKRKIVVICSSCGAVVKVLPEQKICPKCDEPLKDD